jgi:hypothetical protein
MRKRGTGRRKDETNESKSRNERSARAQVYPGPGHSRTRPAVALNALRRSLSLPADPCSMSSTGAPFAELRITVPGDKVRRASRLSPRELFRTKRSGPDRTLVHNPSTFALPENAFSPLHLTFPVAFSQAIFADDSCFMLSTVTASPLPPNGGSSYSGERADAPNGTLLLNCTFASVALYSSLLCLTFLCRMSVSSRISFLRVLSATMAAISL